MRQPLEPFEARDERRRLGIGLGHGGANQRQLEREPRRRRPAHVVLGGQQERDDPRELGRRELLGLDAKALVSIGLDVEQIVLSGRRLHQEQVAEMGQGFGGDVPQVLSVLHQARHGLEDAPGVAHRHGIGQVVLDLALRSTQQRSHHIVVDRGAAHDAGLIQQRERVA